MDLPTKLQRLADARDWNQSDVARKLGLRPSTVQNWFSGRSVPSTKLILKLARLFEVPMEYLVDDEMEQPPAPELSPDDQLILKMARALGFQKAMLRLMDPPAIEARGLPLGR